MTYDPTAAGTVLITGGTGSLGYETAKTIASSGRGLTTVITGRDAGATTKAAAGLRAQGGPVRGMVLDLGSLDDVRRFVEDLTSAGLPPLRAVICNAGIQSVSRTVLTADGFEQTFGVNHLAHFLLVRELLAHLLAPARIVFVASGTHDPARRTGMPSPVYTSARELAVPAQSDGEGNANAVGRRRYTTSKLCNVLATYELARRVQEERPGEAITVNAFDPGLMPGTGLARDYGPVGAFVWNRLMPALTVLPGLNIHTPKQSASALARLVLDESLCGVTGRYFEGRREIRSSADSYDRDKQRDLWDTSVELTRA